MTWSLACQNFTWLWHLSSCSLVWDCYHLHHRWCWLLSRPGSGRTTAFVLTDWPSKDGETWCCPSSKARILTACSAIWFVWRPGMCISVLGKVEETQFNTEVTGVEKLWCCLPSPPTWFSLISKEHPKCSQEPVCIHRCDDHSMAIGAARARCFQPPTNPVLQRHILVGTMGKGVSAFAGRVWGLKKPYELGLLLLL